VLAAGGFGGHGILASVELYVGVAPIVLTSPTKLPGGAFLFSFANTPGARFTAAATTNVSLPLNKWTLLGEPGVVPEPSPGQFQFTDPKGTNFPPRFYNVRLN
jgi:hypothetical protein